MEPTRLTVRAIMSPRRAAHLARSANQVARMTREVEHL